MSKNSEEKNQSIEEKYKPKLITSDFIYSKSNSSEISKTEKNQQQNEIISLIETENKETQPINIQNIVFKEDIESSLIDRQIKELEKLEKLLHDLNLISFNDKTNSYQCNICNDETEEKREKLTFSTSMDLLIHCRKKHQFIISPELRKRISLMRNFTQYPSDTDIFNNAKDLRLDTLFFDPIVLPDLPIKPIDDDSNDQEMIEADSWLSVPPFFADLLVKIFGTDSKQEKFGCTPKVDWKNEIVWLQIPIKVPFLFLTMDGKTKIGFLNTNLLKADESKQMIKSILSTLTKNIIFVAKMENISKNSPFTEENIDSLASKYDIFVLYNQKDTPNSTTVCSLSIFIYSNFYTDELEEKLKADINEMFKLSEMKQCSICKKFYKDGDESVCTTNTLGGLTIKREGASHHPYEGSASRLVFEKKKPNEIAKLLN